MSLQSYYYDYLTHHGIKGQKWGVRRFETKDGHLTPAGKERYGNDGEPMSRKEVKRAAKEDKKALKTAKKIQTKYKAAGDALGRADYYRSKGDEAAKKYREDEDTLRRAADQYEKEGKILRGALARKAADAVKQRGDQARKEYDDIADDYISRSEYYTQKASKISTKKNVELGKKTVDEILNKSRDRGKENAKSYEENKQWLAEKEREWQDWKAENDRKFEEFKRR